MADVCEVYRGHYDFFGFRLTDRLQCHIKKPFPSSQTYVLITTVLHIHSTFHISLNDKPALSKELEDH